MKVSPQVFHRSVRSLVSWMDRWEELGFRSFEEFLEYVGDACLCRLNSGQLSTCQGRKGCARDYEDRLCLVEQ